MSVSHIQFPVIGKDVARRKASLSGGPWNKPQHISSCEDLCRESLLTDEERNGCPAMQVVWTTRCRMSVPLPAHVRSIHSAVYILYLYAPISKQFIHGKYICKFLMISPSKWIL